MSGEPVLASQQADGDVYLTDERNDKIDVERIRAAREMGKPLAESVAEVEKCAGLRRCRGFTAGSVMSMVFDGPSTWSVV
jgi:hypothetical protein